MQTLQSPPFHLAIVSTQKMLSKTTIMILVVVVALFATMTMARNLQANADDSDSLDEPRFSLREVLSLVNAKRTAVRMSHRFFTKGKQYLFARGLNVTESGLLILFSCHMATDDPLTTCLYVNIGL